MKLNTRILGEGEPLFILHGLFGSADNWQTLGRKWSEHYKVFLIDQRNHGHSPHSDEWTYNAMVGDVIELMNDHGISKVNVIGHSMGAKTAMQLAVDNSHLVNKLIVADMAPRYYPPHHGTILAALNSLDLSVIKTRKGAEDHFAKYDFDFGTKQFLLKNLYWANDEQLAWRFNLKTITEKIESVGESFDTSNAPCLVDCLFIRATKAKYFTDDDAKLVATLFPKSKVVNMDCGHWLHAEKPEEFYTLCTEFLQS